MRATNLADPRSHRPHRRRDHQRAGVGARTSARSPDCDLLVDAILGTGFHGPLTGFLETVVADVNDLGVPVVAIDLPTGVSADSRGRRAGDRGVDDGDAGGAEDSARVCRPPTRTAAIS